MEASVNIKDNNGHFMLSEFDGGRIWMSLYVNRAHVTVVMTKAEAWELIKALGQFAGEFTPAPEQPEQKAEA